MNEAPKNIRVLIVEDSETDAQLTLRLLAQGGYAPESLRVDSRETLEQALREQTWDAVLSDYKMPGFNGAEALKIVLQSGQDVPFIIISGTIGEETAVALMKAGAHDFLLKDDLGRLVPAVDRELREAEVRREKRQKEASLLKSEENLRKAEKIAMLGNWEWNIVANELIWSEEVYRLYGADPKTQKPSYDIIVQTMAPECRDQFVNAVDDAVKHGKHFEGEYRVIGLDGEVRYMHTVGEVVRDREGNPVSMFGIVRDITRRMQAEEELRRSEERFRSIFENATDGIMIADLAQKRNIEANKAICSMLGYTREEVLAIGVAGLHPKEDLQRIIELFERQARGEISLAQDIPLIRKDGSVLYADVNSTHIILAGRHCLLGIFRDITERKKAEAALKTREKQLAESQRIAHVGSWAHNPGTGEIFWSDELFRLLGLDPAKDRADFGTFFSRVHPDDQPALKAAVEASLREKKPFDLEYRFVIPGEPVKFIHARADLAPDAAGDLSVLSGTGQDITARKQAEEKIWQSEEFIRGILDTVDEGFIVIDRDYRIMTANKAYCGQVARPCDEIIGRRCHEISHHISRPCHEEGEECAVRQVFATGKPHAALHKHPGRDGQVLYMETKGFPIKDASGNVTSVIETINNITEKYLLEEERLKTQKLESIGTLAGGIAHDFNNLLQGVFGYISMAKMLFDQRERALAMLEQAEKAVHQSVNLTTQLLTFSKGGKPVKKSIALAPVIENAAKFALSGSRSGFRLDIEPGLWQADADGGQVGQVIQNIVLNADQAMPQGGRVTIMARNLPASDAPSHPGMPRGDYIVITVEDQGVGIPEAYLDKIFDPYFTTKEKGSGLGLATSYSIIRNHGGRIEVRSSPGKGSIFSLYLPAIRTEASLPEKQPLPAQARKAQVLVMDDEELIRHVARELLGSLGHEVTLAENGEAAIELYGRAKAEGRPFDAVILDLTIRGGKGGAETMRELLKLDPGVHAIVSSGYSDDEIIAAYRQHGFRAFLKKPYHVEDLARALSDAGA